MTSLLITKDILNIVTKQKEYDWYTSLSLTNNL